MPQCIHHLILASESPRRKQLLTEAGFQFTVFPIKVSEYLEKNLNLDEQIKDIALRKSREAEKQLNLLKQNDFLLLTADTMVVLQDEAIGKPENKIHAEQMLAGLSGRSHQVKTAICLFESRTQNRVCEIETTQVHFRLISRPEIRQYIDSGEPMDKAGAYAIQGAGGNFVDKIEGDYNNVVGLPVNLLLRILQTHTWLKN